jgi:hypothetical protein
VSAIAALSAERQFRFGWDGECLGAFMFMDSPPIAVVLPSTATPRKNSLAPNMHDNGGAVLLLGAGGAMFKPRAAGNHPGFRLLGKMKRESLEVVARSTGPGAGAARRRGRQMLAPKPLPEIGRGVFGIELGVLTRETVVSCCFAGRHKLLCSNSSET